MTGSTEFVCWSLAVLFVASAIAAGCYFSDSAWPMLALWFLPEQPKGKSNGD